MKPHSTRSSSISRSSNRGSILIDAGIAFLVVALFVGSLLPLSQSLRASLVHAGGSSDLHTRVDAELYKFRSDAAGTVPDVTPLALGKNDAGESLQRIESTAYDATLGLRTLSVVVFVPATQHAAIGGAARLEPLSPITWRPDASGVSTADTAYQLTLSPATVPANGTVSGSGFYPIGSVVQITAKPFPGHAFVSWGGTAIIGNRNAASTTVTIDEDRTLIANFTP